MTDYTAWLVEINDQPGGPIYFQLAQDDDWTKDHNAALHLSRREDADRVIEYYGWTRAKAVEHMWPEPIAREIIAESNGHHWIKAFSMVCCRDCGMVRRHDDQNKPCKGTVSVGPRDTNLYGSGAPAFPVPTDSIERARMKKPRKNADNGF